MPALAADPTIRREVACIGPVFFHLMTRPVLEQVVPLPMELDTAVDDRIAASLEGLQA